MILFRCMKKTSEELASGTKYEVWFQEQGRVHAERVPGKMAADTDWKRYEVSKEQYDRLSVGSDYMLTICHGTISGRIRYDSVG